MFHPNFAMMQKQCHCSRNQTSGFDFGTCGVTPSYEGGSMLEHQELPQPQGSNYQCLAYQIARLGCSVA